MGRSVRDRGVRELLDRAHPVGTPTGPCGLLHRSHVERHRTHLAQRSRVSEAGHARRERPHEARPAHLTVADDVESRLLLIEDRSIDGVVERLLDVGRAEAIGLHQLLRGVEPRRVRVPADDGRREQRKIGRHRALSRHQEGVTAVGMSISTARPRYVSVARSRSSYTRMRTSSAWCGSPGSWPTARRGDGADRTGVGDDEQPRPGRRPLDLLHHAVPVAAHDHRRRFEVVRRLGEPVGDRVAAGELDAEDAVHLDHPARPVAAAVALVALEHPREALEGGR